MRFVAGRNEVDYQSQQTKQGELERHVDALSLLAERALQSGIDAPVCTLVLRSAKSTPVSALAQTQDALAAAGVIVRAVLTRIEPGQELYSLLALLAALAPDGDLEAHVRWARNPGLLDAHEQAVYGEDLYWAGDAVRRASDKRNQLVLFENTPDALLRGAHAFKALWAASDPIPAHLVDIGAAAAAHSAEACGKGASLAATARPVEGWPLLRH